MAGGRVLLKDIAARAGVTTAAVSMALRNHPNIPKATCERIQALARQMNYIPDPMLSSLSVYKRKVRPLKYQSTIVYLNCWPNRHEWKKNFTFKLTFDSAVKEASKWGYALEEFWFKEPGMTAARCTQILRARNIQGLLIAPMPSTPSHLSLDWTQFAAVTFGYSLTRPRLHIASNNQYNSIISALREVRKYGYRRIGLAMPELSNVRANYHWSAGFVEEQRRFSTSDHIPLLMPKDFTETAFESWFERHKPEVVMSLRTPVPRWLKKMGLKMPEDVGYVDLNCESADDHPSGINQCIARVGETAVNFLIGMLQRNELGKPQIAQSLLVDGHWVDGTTLRRKY